MLFTIGMLLVSTAASAAPKGPKFPSAPALPSSQARGVDIDPGFQLPPALEALQKDCTKWGQRAINKYTLYNDLWQDNLARGVQCSSIISPMSVSWFTTYDWSPLDLPSPALSRIAALPVRFNTRYAGRGIVANVAFDMFVSKPGRESIEVMVHYGAYGGASPISNTGIPIAVVSLAGKTWNLFFGRNEGAHTNVYSFMATDAAHSFRIDAHANLVVFFDDLVHRGFFTPDYAVNSISFGSEVFKGHKSLFLVEDYSLETIYR